MIAIKHRFTGATICEFDVKTIKEASELSKANLSRADLYGAYLYGANLSGADLYGANLSRADLSRADLSGANLSRADLSGANLSGANLSRANLSGADLYGANLYGAKIDGEKITKNPLSITGLDYRCLITDGYMRLGCKRYTHAEWSGFNDSEIEEMDSHATEFWNQWKLPLLAMCRQHAKSK